jgi:hypothetical protein
MLTRQKKVTFAHFRYLCAMYTHTLNILHTYAHIYTREQKSFCVWRIFLLGGRVAPLMHRIDTQSLPLKIIFFQFFFIFSQSCDVVMLYLLF